MKDSINIMPEVPELPDDIIHLICEQLGAQGDFASLYRCALSSPRFCDSALKTLYRLHDRTALVTGQDELELLRQRRPGNAPTTFVRQNAERDLITKKWALLWKSMIRSSLDGDNGTFRPYVAYIRSLNLRDLESLFELFEDQKYRATLEKTFFAGDLARFNVRKNSTFLKDKKTGKPLQVLDSELALNAVGEAITRKAYLLEELGGHRVTSSQLPNWVRCLPRLEAIRIWSGAALKDGAGGAIRETCPNFKALTIFAWREPDADEGFAFFLSELSANTLQHFETISPSQIAGQSFSALSEYHGSSLQSLKLAALSEPAIKSLDKLSFCTAIRTLSLEDFSGAIRLDETQNDVFLAVIRWLSSCRDLANLDFNRFTSAPAILASVLEPASALTGGTTDSIAPTSSSTPPPPPLSHLGIENYSFLHPSSSNFHSLLPNLSSTLRSLSLKADGEDAMPADLDILVNSIRCLTRLQSLYLKDISDNFTNDHIIQLACSLPNLVELWTSGAEITDAVLPALNTLRKLKVLQMYATTQFTFDGILEFIHNLQSIENDGQTDIIYHGTLEGPLDGGNKGFSLLIMNAEVGWGLNETQQAMLRSEIETRVGGRFDFTLWRGESANQGRWIGEHDLIYPLD
ncbi:hypothetical protein UCRPC4_g00130 [Phaeomoniella chlamydospora]|uniref:Uncharacterized protein n=1 Tax=Phaeomoniella chlamydospora TaxID=158046 RepID=A0A0G2F4H8_PHACM|nr:hypothetical protein UCRPC4_g00130 [Phaeomoniella chlamydospora]